MLWHLHLQTEESTAVFVNILPYKQFRMLGIDCYRKIISLKVKQKAGSWADSSHLMTGVNQGIKKKQKTSDIL